MLRWIKNRGYPVTIAPKTLWSPSSYATLSSQVGSDTDIACAVRAGTEAPIASWPPTVVVVVLLMAVVNGSELGQIEVKSEFSTELDQHALSRVRVTV